MPGRTNGGWGDQSIDGIFTASYGCQKGELDQSIMGRGWRAALRSGIWLLAVFVGLYPVSHALHLRPTVHLIQLAEAANQKALFRDYFFVAVVLVTASFGNVLYCMVNVERLPSWAKALFVFTMLYYFYVLMYGVSRFAELAEITTPVELPELHDDLWFMGFAVAVTLLAELGISLTEKVEPSIVPAV